MPVNRKKIFKSPQCTIPEAVDGCQHHVNGIQRMDKIWWKRTFLLNSV